MPGRENVSAAEVATFLKGIDFPKSKAELIDHAEDNNAPPEVINLLEELPDRDYSSMAEVEHEVGVKM